MSIKLENDDPLVYLGVFSIVLFILICFNFSLLLPSQADFETGLFANKKENALLQKLFLGQEDFSPLESPDLLLVSQTGIMPASAPTTLTSKVLGSLIGTEADSEIRRDVVEYIVETGDTLWSIAGKFDISLETILSANDLTRATLIQPGQKLIILPVSGIIHHVNKGETVTGIAKTYGAKTQDIVSFNGLLEQGDIFVGDILIVPGGTMPAPSLQYASKWVPLASSYFICPITEPCRITQGLHWYNAVDFSHGSCGEPIYAAAGGTVLRVKLTSSRSQWAFEGAGNHITVLHPNGSVTFYGHIANALVNPGERVSQGQAIALIGGQPGTAGAGRSTGCHVHFAVHGARNPFAQ